MMHKKKPTDEEIKQTEGWGTWNKEPSEFPWSYTDKETCYILEGSATVTAEDGSAISFSTGDMVVFEKGLECTWKIDKEIRKRFKFG